jgi:LL-H family phage holin
MQISDTQIIAVSVALAPFLISVATFLYKSYLSRLPQSKQNLLMTIARTAVQAAEQMGNGAAGPAKKKIAEDAVSAALKSLGLSIDPAFVNAAIESLVFAMNQEKSQQDGVRPLDTSRISG